MGAVAKDEDALAGQIGAVRRIARPPRLAQAVTISCAVLAANARLRHKVCVSHPHRWAQLWCKADSNSFSQNRAAALAGFWVKQHIEMGPTHSAMSRGVAPIGPRTFTSIAQFIQQFGDLLKSSRWRNPKRRWANDIAADRASFHRLGQMFDDLKERLVRAKVFLALIAGQFQGDHGHGRPIVSAKTTGIILDQFGVQEAPTMIASGLKRS